MARPVVVSTSAVIQVPRTDLWEFLADTDRLNREIGLSPVHFAPVLDRRKGHFTAEARSYGRTFTYEEFPFEWVEGRYYRVVRRFATGPVSELTTGVRLSPAPKGTEVEVFSVIVPRNVLGAARTMLTRASSKATIGLAREFEQHRRDPGAHPAPAPPPNGVVNLALLERRSAAMILAPEPAELAERVAHHLRTASDQDVVLMRPFDLADRWGVDRVQLLLVFLRAARSGLVDLRWSLLCPLCRTVRDGDNRLQKLASQVHCETCDIRFDADLARSVEVRFSVNPAVRRAEQSRYCIGGPAHTPSAVAQIRLEPGTRRTESLDVESGTVRVRCYQVGTPILCAVGENGGVLDVRCLPDEFIADSTPTGSGGSRLEVTNERDDEVLVIVERESWRDGAATAALVTSLQGFKDLFPDQGVAPGDEVGIGNLAVLFTDLGGSTAMYERVGDVTAFAFVQSHFRYLGAAIEKHNGGVVKKMGDAVMATFADPVDAWAAACDMQSGWEEFRARSACADDSVTLKIGVHQGPAVMIDNDGHVDYFGATVNLAARVQGRSVGGDIVVSRAIYDDPDITALSAASAYFCEKFVAELKGVRGEQTLYRLRG